MIACVFVAGATLSLSGIAEAGDRNLGRGGKASVSGRAVRTPQGGTAAVGSRSIQTQSGRMGTSNGYVLSNGTGGAQYGGTTTQTTPNGKTYTGSTNGSIQYNSATGIQGINTTTVNGQTYYSQSSGGTVTIMNPSGQTQTYTRPR
jgi:hypothetical protein